MLLSPLSDNSKQTYEAGPTPVVHYRAALIETPIQIERGTRDLSDKTYGPSEWSYNSPDQTLTKTRVTRLPAKWKLADKEPSDLWPREVQSVNIRRLGALVPQITRKLSEDGVSDEDDQHYLPVMSTTHLSSYRDTTSTSLRQTTITRRNPINPHTFVSPIGAHPVSILKHPVENPDEALHGLSDDEFSLQTLSPEELRRRLRMTKQNLKQEREQRAQLTDMCSSLMEENRKLRVNWPDDPQQRVRTILPSVRTYRPTDQPTTLSPIPRVMTRPNSRAPTTTLVVKPRKFDAETDL